MPAPRLNGLRGVVDATPDGKIVCSGGAKIAVMLEGGRGTKAVLFENQVDLPPTEAEEKHRKKREKAKRQKAKKQAAARGGDGQRVWLPAIEARGTNTPAVVMEW
jgi:hypothetical protein